MTCLLVWCLWTCHCRRHLHSRFSSFALSFLLRAVGRHPVRGCPHLLGCLHRSFLVERTHGVGRGRRIDWHCLGGHSHGLLLRHSSRHWEHLCLRFLCKHSRGHRLHLGLRCYSCGHSYSRLLFVPLLARLLGVLCPCKFFSILKTSRAPVRMHSQAGR